MPTSGGKRGEAGGDPRQGALPPAPLFYELISVFDVLPNGSLWCMLRYNYGSMFSRTSIMAYQRKLGSKLSL